MKKDKITKEANDLIDKLMDDLHNYYEVNIELCLMLANKENEVVKKAVEITNRTINDFSSFNN